MTNPPANDAPLKAFSELRFFPSGDFPFNGFPHKIGAILFGPENRFDPLESPLGETSVHVLSPFLLTAHTHWNSGFSSH
jgi:hypothetical protein